MSTRLELTNEVREEAFAYVDAVVARAEGTGPGGVTDSAGEGSRPLLARIVPGPVKRAVVRMLIYVMRHPFDHLSQPLQTQLEEEIGQARGMAHAALTRAEHSAAELRRLRAELNRQRPSR
jgi:hypothetical protein